MLAAYIASIAVSRIETAVHTGFIGREHRLVAGGRIPRVLQATLRHNMGQI